MKQVKLHFKNGSTIEFECEDITIKKYELSGTFSELSWKRPNKKISFNINELIATEVKEGADE